MWPDKGVDFINGAAQAGNPFLLEIATFAPHAPSTPAPRDAQDFPGLKVPRTPAFNAQNTNPPAWLAGRPPLNPAEIATWTPGSESAPSRCRRSTT